MRDEPLQLIAHKSDVDRARRLVALGYPRVAPVLPFMLEWIQDCNWPVADELLPFFASVGRPMLPEIKRVFATNDDVWKYWCILLLGRMDLEILEEMRAHLDAVARQPTRGEEEEGVAEEARNLLMRIDAK